MTRPNRDLLEGIALLLLAAAVVVGLLLYVDHAEDECDGTLVRGALNGFECIEDPAL